MRYQELNETEKMSGEEVWDLIERDCQPFLNEWDGQGYLYRGIKEQDTSRSEQFIEMQVRKDRRPRDTERVMHDALVLAFNESGFKANRDNSIFCSGSRALIDFGELYAIFPKGNFEVTWSNHIKDWTQDKKIYDWLKKPKSHGYPLQADNLTLDDIRLKGDTGIGDTGLIRCIDSNYIDGDLNSAIASHNEIMISCDSFYGILANSYNYIPMLRDVAPFIKRKYG